MTLTLEEFINQVDLLVIKSFEQQSAREKGLVRSAVTRLFKKIYKSHGAEARSAILNYLNLLKITTLQEHWIEIDYFIWKYDYKPGAYCCDTYTGRCIGWLDVETLIPQELPIVNANSFPAKGIRVSFNKLAVVDFPGWCEAEALPYEFLCVEDFDSDILVVRQAVSGYYQPAEHLPYYYDLEQNYLFVKNNFSTPDGEYRRAWKYWGSKSCDWYVAHGLCEQESEQLELF